MAETDNEKLSVLMSFVTKAYNKTETELNDIICDETGVKQDAFENLLTLDSARVKKLKGDSQAMFDKGYQKAEAEIKSKAEKTFKEKTGFDHDAETFEELIEKYVADQGTKTKKSATTDDEIKKHPLYLALEKEKAKIIAESIPKAEHEKFVQEVERKEKFSLVKSKVLEKLQAINIAPIENQAVKKKRIELFLKEFEGYDYQLDGENIVVLNPDGTRKEDDHGNPFDFNKLIENTVSEHFEILKQAPKGSAGNSNPDDNKNKGLVIKDEAHYKELMAELDNRQSKEKDPAKVIEIRKERAKLGETWMSQGK